jgi:hypothetical protein
MSRRPGLIAGTVLAGAFYALLVDTTSIPEPYVLVAVAITVAAAIVAALRQGDGLERMRIRSRWLLRGWGAIVRIPAGAAVLTREALSQLVSPRQTRGRLHAVRFRGGEDDEETGRQVLTEFFGSLAPDTIVIGTDPDRELLLVHKLGGREGEIDVLELG